MNVREYKKALDDCANLSVIIQVTDKCVLSCKYCFARGAHHGDNPRFPDDLLDKIIFQAFQTHHQSVTFEWTGGEAFLLGKEFYQKVKSLQQRYATKNYINCIQTSGYLFDKELIDYLLSEDFAISLTLDGPEKIHNANRPAQNGRDSFRQVMETHRYITEKVGECGFISTITRNNLGHEKEMLDFFKDLGVYSFHSNPYIYFDKNIVKDKAIALDSNDYARYFISQFNAWYENGKLEPVPHTIDYFATGLTTKQAPNRTLCSFGGRCLSNFITIIPNGDCYNCPKFTGHYNMRLGNLYENTITEILDADQNPKMKDMLEQRVKILNKCLDNSCRFAFLCNGGCPYLSYIASGGKNVSEKDCTCKGKSMVMEYIESVRNALILEEISLQSEP